MSRYRPPTNLPTDPAQLAAVLLEHLRKISEDLSTIPSDDVNTVVVQERIDVPAGSTRRISPPTTGGIAILEAPGPSNTGKKAVIIIENPAGSLKVVASPHRAADGKITASTINDASQATYTLPGVVTFTSNGVDSWKTQAEVPAETAPSTTTTALFEALDASFHVQTADSNLPNARVATSSDSIEVDHTTGGQVKWNVKQGTSYDVSLSGTLNNYALPSGFNNGDTLNVLITANTTITGFALTPAQTSGFWFNLVLYSNGGPFSLSFVDESASSTDVNRIRSPGSVGGSAPNYVLNTEEETITFLYSEPVAAGNSRWRVISCTAAQAVTGDVVIAAGNGSTRTAAIGTGVIVNSDVNASAAIAQTKLGATTGFSVKASGASATTSAEPIVTYSASSNMTAERVATSSTSVTVSTSVANQIEFQRAALTGAITASANANATLFDTNASGAGLTGGGTAVLAVGAGTGITVNANDVAVTNPMPAVGPIGSQLVSFGSFASPMWCHVITEQFFGGGATTTISGQWGWGVSNVTEQDTLGPEPGHSGIRRYLRAGGGHGYAYSANVAADLGEIDIADVAFLYFVVRIPNTGAQTDLTSRRFMIGLAQDASDTSGNTPDLGGNGLVLIKISSSTSWIIKDENASAATNTTTETAVLDDWVECLLVNEGGGDWGILINGVDHGTHSGVVTSGVMTPVISVDGTAVDTYFDVDEFTIGFLSSVNRYG